MGQHFTLGAGPAQIMGQHVLPRLYGCRRLWVWVDPMSRKRLRSHWQLMVDEAAQMRVDRYVRAPGDRDICCSSRAYVICHCHWCMSIPHLYWVIRQWTVVLAELRWHSFLQNNPSWHTQTVVESARWRTGYSLRTVSCLDQSVKVVSSVTRINFWYCCLFFYVNGWLLSIISLGLSV